MIESVPQRQAGSIRNAVIVVVLLLLVIAFAPGNTFLKVTVEWTPAVHNSRVVWSCKVTFPERFCKLAPPPCPESP